MIKLYMTVGLPGCGKSTFVRKRIEQYGGIHISRDIIRFSIVRPDEEYFSKENIVFDIFINQIQQAIDDKIENIYVDATHLTEKGRNKVLNRLKLNEEVQIHILMFDVPLNICLERNAKRTGREVVPEIVIRRMRHSIGVPNFFEKYHYTSISEINEDGLFINRWTPADKKELERWIKNAENLVN